MNVFINQIRLKKNPTLTQHFFINSKIQFYDKTKKNHAL